jgi:hypothetical protein
VANIKLNKTAVIHYILIYLFIVFHGATIYAVNKGYWQLVIELICAFLWMKYHRIRKVSVLILLCVLFFLTLTVSFAARSGTGLTFFRAVADEIVIAYTVIFYDKKNFFNRFFKLLSIFACISLIFYVILIKYPSILFDLFTKGVGVSNFIHYGGIIFSFNVINGNVDLRNSGIFTEPGIYAVVLISAVYALLFLNVYHNIGTKLRYTYFLIFIITILSTLSTIAYLVLGIVIIGYIVSSDRVGQYIKEKRKLVILCLIFIIMLAVDYYTQGDVSILSTYVLSKADSNALLTKESSGNARLVTIETCLSTITKYPFGAGGNYITAALPDYAVAAQFLVYTAGMGLINAGILYLYFLIPAYKNRPSLIAFCTFILMYIMLSLAQSQVWYPSLLMFPIMWKSLNKIPRVKCKLSIVSTQR